MAQKRGVLKLPMKEWALVHYASIFSSLLVKQKQQALFEHFRGIFSENIFSKELKIFSYKEMKACSPNWRNKVKYNQVETQERLATAVMW